MADEKRSRPKSLDRRYERLSEDKNTYYALRRYLNYTPKEVDAMPWWERRMWIEKINEEFAPPESGPAGSPPATETPNGAEVYDDVTVLGITPETLA